MDDDSSVDKSMVTEHSRLVNKLNFDKSDNKLPDHPYFHHEKGEHDITMENVQKTPLDPHQKKKLKAVFQVENSKIADFAQNTNTSA